MAFDNNWQASAGLFNVPPSSHVMPTFNNNQAQNWVSQEDHFHQLPASGNAYHQYAPVMNENINANAQNPNWSTTGQFATDARFVQHVDHSYMTASPVPGYNTGSEGASSPASSANTQNRDSNTPYNQLLVRCFNAHDDQECILKEIYDWFGNNTDKTSRKGWKNSIRHNLSMNQAFKRGSRRDPDSPPPNSWYLTDQAIHDGVEPTTRFRNPARRARYNNRSLSARPQHASRHARMAPRLRRAPASWRSDSPLARSTAHSSPALTNSDGTQHHLNGDNRSGQVSNWGYEALYARTAPPPAFNPTSHPPAFAPYNSPHTPSMYMSPAMGHHGYHPQIAMPASTLSVSPEELHNGWHNTTWISNTQQMAMSAASTPLSNTPELEAPRLSAIPADVRPSPVFDFGSNEGGSPSSVPHTPDVTAETVDGLGIDFPDGFFTVGNAAVQQCLMLPGIVDRCSV